MRADFFVSLKSKKRIEALFSAGRKVFSRHLMLRFTPVAESNPPLSIVFAVSRKLGDAHVRNLAKRRLREALYLILKDARVVCRGFDVAIIPKKEVVDVDFAELTHDLETAFKRLPRTKP